MIKPGWLCACGASVLLIGCAAPTPTEKLESTSAAIRAAQEVGSDRDPSAALHLQLAKEQSDRANKLIADGDKEEASLVLMRAESDANLAVALARNAEEQREAASAEERVRSLQQQNVQ
jgi:hypothetical protein